MVAVRLVRDSSHLLAVNGTTNISRSDMYLDGAHTKEDMIESYVELYSVGWGHPKKKIILHSKYLCYFPQTNIVVPIAISAIKQAYFLPSSNIIGRISYSCMLFDLQLT